MEKDTRDKDNDRDERQRERESNRNLEEIRLNQTLSNNNKSSGLKPKFNKFDEANDKIDSYLFRFEVICDGWEVPHEERALYLAPQLTGKALEEYRKLDLPDCNDYHLLRHALLKAYRCTREGYRQQIKDLRPNKNESFNTYTSELKKLVNSWIDSSAINKDYDSLLELITLDWAFDSFSKDLTAFLKERDAHSISEIETLGEFFRTAHPEKPLTNQLRNPHANFATVNSNTRGRPENRYNMAHERGRSFDRRRTRYGRSVPPMKRYPMRDRSVNNNVRHQPTRSYQDNVIICYHCGRQGHMAHECYSRSKSLFCSYCRKGGHTFDNCYERRRRNERTGQRDNGRPRGAPQEVRAMSLAADRDKPDEGKLARGSLQIHQGFANGLLATVLFDSGCDIVGVARQLIHESHLQDSYVTCTTFNGSKEKLQKARVEIDTPLFTGTVNCVALDNPVADIIVGNIPGLLPANDENFSNWYNRHGIPVNCMMAETRQQSKARASLEVRHDSKEFFNIAQMTVEQFKIEQLEDKSLESLWQRSKDRRIKNTKSGKISTVCMNSLLYRKFTNEKSEAIYQLCIPKSCRLAVLKLAHDQPLSGHQGAKKTLQRIRQHFHWPKLHYAVTTYCRTCDVCQRTVQKGRLYKVPLQVTKVFTQPYDKVAVDIVGPIIPPSSTGCRYIVTCIDIASRYPEAVCVRNIETITIADVLMTIFCRLGFPRQILSDSGSQFTSDMFKELMKQMNITPLRSTPFHQQSNGINERFNGILKKGIQRICTDQPKLWDKFIPPLLFAYREIPNESTSFSPFFLMFGRTPNSPIAMLKSVLTGEENQAANRTLYQYIIELAQTFTSAYKTAISHNEAVINRNKQYYDRSTQDRLLNIGDMVLVILPASKATLFAQWKGPYKVTNIISPVNYEISVNGAKRVYHINILKKYHIRDEDQVCAATGIFRDEEDEDVQDSLRTVQPSLHQEECIEDVNVNSDLQPSEKRQVANFLEQYKDVLTDLPGKTRTIEHKIRVTTEKPIYVKPYPLPFHSRNQVNEEIDSMLKLGIIRPSDSPYSSPIVLVKKQDGKIRFCVDYRKLNSITIPDSEPIPNQDDLIAQLTDAQVFSKVDLTKGYWQIPMEEESIKYTAFSCIKGHYEFLFMSFGLMNAPRTFARLLRIVLHDTVGQISFFDDICCYESTLTKNILVLGNVLEALRKHGLTAKPSKTFIGFPEITFLGHTIGGGKQKPMSDKTKQIFNLPQPKTKRQLRKVLGLVGFYRKFIPNFATIVAPLSNGTRKTEPDKVQWSDDKQKALDEIKTRMSSGPILRLPDFDRKFTIRTDASMTGLGAVLMQSHNSILHPIQYASRRLLPRESNYPIIQLECLAIVWGISKFDRFLRMAPFTVQTDHRPLGFLRENRSTNSRLCRWALCLMEYNFTIEDIPGSKNKLADAMSRQYE